MNKTSPAWDEHAFWRKLVLPQEDKKNTLGREGLPVVPLTQYYSDRAVAAEK
jgi:hypothetical protein